MGINYQSGTGMPMRLRDWGNPQGSPYVAAAHQHPCPGFLEQDYAYLIAGLIASMHEPQNRMYSQLVFDIKKKLHCFLS